MSRSLPGRLAAPSFLRRTRVSGLRNVCPVARSFSASTARWEDSKRPGPPKPSTTRTTTSKPAAPSLLESLYGNSSRAAEAKTSESTAMGDLSKSLVFQALNKSPVDTSALSGAASATPQSPSTPTQGRDGEPYHFHIMCHRHNTHVTCSKPNRDAIISMSCGNIGFSKAKRGTFDAAYSLTKYVLERLTHMGWPPKMKQVEIVMRGFGKGRDAAVKVLMSPEGKILRDKIIRVSDATRIKFAGTRSKKKRRL